MDTTPRRYWKNPQDIEAVQFDGNPPDNPNIKIRQIDGVYQIYNKLHDSWVNIKIGDFYRTDREEDYYPIDAQYMKENYTEVK